MAVLVRVKRKRDELPSDTLIIAAPRMKRERSTKEKLLADFGGMGLEGYVRLGFRKEMEAIEDPVEREKYFQTKVAELYANGKAVSIASVLEIDEVIDPADTRHWIMAGLRSVPKPEPRTTRKRPCIDAW